VGEKKRKRYLFQKDVAEEDDSMEGVIGDAGGPYPG